MYYRRDAAGARNVCDGQHSRRREPWSERSGVLPSACARRYGEKTVRVLSCRRQTAGSRPDAKRRSSPLELLTMPTERVIYTVARRACVIARQEGEGGAALVRPTRKKQNGRTQGSRSANVDGARKVRRGWTWGKIKCNPTLRCGPARRGERSAVDAHASTPRSPTRKERGTGPRGKRARDSATITRRREDGRGPDRHMRIGWRSAGGGGADGGGTMWKARGRT